MKNYDKPNSFAILFLACCALLAHASSASVDQQSILVSFKGQVEYRPTPTSEWQRAQTGETLAIGAQLKTQAVSSANILFPDGTQIKLAESSELTIRAAKTNDTKKLSSADLLLSRGKLWGRAKDLSGQLSVSTPTATAAVRGTEWEVDATTPGVGTVTVLSGQVELSNAEGSVLLNKNMLGTAKVNQKPSTSRINNARDRVQWVSHYRPLPALYFDISINTPASDGEADVIDQQICEDAVGVTELNMAANDQLSLETLKSCALHAMTKNKVKIAFDLLQAHKNLAESWLGLQIKADLAALSGDYEKAQNIFDSTRDERNINTAIDAQRAAIDLHFGHLHKVTAYLNSAEFKSSKSPQKYLVAGDYFFLEGEFFNSEAAFHAALDIDMTKIEALIRLAKLNREYGNALKSQALLNVALELEPENYLAKSQNAELQLTNANYGAAISAFQSILLDSPDDLLALNALAEAYLAENRLEEALKSTQKAGLVEPASALPNLTAGLIRHQKGNLKGSYGEFLDASEKDPRNPLPMFLLSAISADEYRIDEAMDFSKAALKRIPYLKSLDKVSSDQNGSSNIGNAYSKFGLEDFAKLYALDSYQSNWAGSQFFLAEREPDSFARSSLSLRGFINEPTTFGASKRRISLVNRSNVSTEVIYDRSGESDIKSDDLRVAVSGLTFAPVPLSFFVQQTKGNTQDNGYGKEFSDTVSSISSAYSPFVTGSVIADAKMGSAWERQISRAEKDITTLGLGIKPTSQLSLFALYVDSEEQSPVSRIGANADKITSADSYLTLDKSDADVSLSEALRLFPLINETTEGRYVNKLFIAGFKFQISDSLSLLGKHSRTSNFSDVAYSDTTICQLSTLTNQSVGLELQDALFPMYQEIGFLNNFYSPQNPNAMPDSFWELYDQALKRDFGGECPQSAFSDKSYQTHLAGYNRKSDSLRDASLFLEMSGPKVDFSIGYEISKARNINSWGSTGTDINHYQASAAAITKEIGSLPGIDFFCGISPIQSPLCQSIVGGQSALFNTLIGTSNFVEETGFYGRDSLQSQYVSAHVKFKAHDKAVLEIAIQGVDTKASFFKRYRDTAVDYLYGGFGIFFPGADVSDVTGDTVSIQAPQASLTDPSGSGWKFRASASLLLKPREGVYINIGHTDFVKPNLNVTLAPVYLGFSPSLPYRVGGDSRVSTQRVGATFITDDDALFRVSLSQSKISPEKISDNSGWGGSFIAPSTKGYTEWLTSDVFDQMRSNKLRGLNTSVGPYQGALCSNCRRNTKLEFAGNLVLSEKLSASLTYIHHWKSKVSPIGASDFLSGSLECLSAVIDDTACSRRQLSLYNGQVFPRHYIKTGITWLPMPNIEASLLVEHVTQTEMLLAADKAATEQPIEIIASRQWTDAHAMLRWQSSDRKFRVEAMMNSIFSAKYPANFVIRSSLNF